MANRRNLLVVALATLMPLSLVTAVATPASARVITPSGNVSCDVGGSLTFSPPLSPGDGTPNVSDEVVSTDLTLSVARVPRTPWARSRRPPPRS